MSIISFKTPWINYQHRKPVPDKHVIITWCHMGDTHFKEFKSFDECDLGFLEDIEHAWWTLSPFRDSRNQ